MKLSDETIVIMKNMITINPSLYVNVGNQLRTISPQKTIICSAEVDESFDTPFGIYNLGQLISVMSLFETPDIELDDKFLTVSNDSASVQYYYTDSRMITQPPAKELVLPDSLISFKISQDIIKRSMMAANVLQLAEWCVEADGSNLYIVVQDIKNPTGNKFRVKLDDTDKEFNIVFKVENMRFLPKNYSVTISERGLSHFTTDDGKLNYWIATESRK